MTQQTHHRLNTPITHHPSFNARSTVNLQNPSNQQLYDSYVRGVNGNISQQQQQQQQQHSLPHQHQHQYQYPTPTHNVHHSNMQHKNPFSAQYSHSSQYNSHNTRPQQTTSKEFQNSMQANSNNNNLKQQNYQQYPIPQNNSQYVNNAHHYQKPDRPYTSYSATSSSSLSSPQNSHLNSLSPGNVPSNVKRNILESPFNRSSHGQTLYNDLDSRKSQFDDGLSENNYLNRAPNNSSLNDVVSVDHDDDLIEWVHCFR